MPSRAVLSDVERSLLRHRNAVLIIDATGVVVAANDAARRMFGADPVGRPCRALELRGALPGWECETCPIVTRRGPPRARLAASGAGTPLVELPSATTEGRHAIVLCTANSGERSEGALTSREREVLALLALGCPTDEIARQLGIRANTVRNHVQAILTKLDARSRLEAVSIARRSGLLD